MAAAESATGRPPLTLAESGPALYPPEVDHGDYTLLEELGKGAFSTVFRAQHKKTAEMMAVKVIDAARLAKEGSCDPQRVVLEIQILSKLQHPNIVRMISAKVSHDRKLHVVMELCNRGELFEHIIQREHYTEADAVQVMRQVLLAVAHLHSHDIIHRDIKPENVLVHQLPDRLVFKLTDFGLAKHLHGNTNPPSSVTPVTSRNTVCGTPTYSAPEVWTGVYSHVADCFSTGVLMFVLLAGHFPAFSRQVPQLPAEQWDCVSAGAKELLLLLLLHDPAKRATAQQALEHPWFSQVAPPTPLASAQQQLKSSRASRQSPVFNIEREAPPMLAPPPKRAKPASPSRKKLTTPTPKEEPSALDNSRKKST